MTQLELLFEDNHLLIINKPAGVLTQPDQTNRESLEEGAKKYIKSAYNKPGAVYLHAVHRIDRLVSGSVLFARTSKALSRLNEKMRQGHIKKTYHAIVSGTLPSKAGNLTHYLRHSGHHAKIVTASTPNARLARLSYKVIKQLKQGTLVEIVLETGRYHQIRAQFSAIQCPILGDEKYESAFSFSPNAIALHSRSLAFEHPVSHKALSIIAPYPTRWNAYLGR